MDSTFRGLNKFSVNEYHQYFCTDDSLDIPDNHIQDIFLDSKKRLVDIDSKRCVPVYR